MAIGNVISLERAQAKIEAVRGTLEATQTRWLYFVQGTMSWSLEIPVDDTKEAMRTYYNTDNPDGGIPICRLSMELVLSYEEIVWWLNMILEGGNLTGAALGGTPIAYGYTFDPTGASDDLKTFSLVAGAIYTYIDQDSWNSNDWIRRALTMWAVGTVFYILMKTPLRTLSVRADNRLGRP